MRRIETRRRTHWTLTLGAALALVACGGGQSGAPEETATAPLDLADAACNRLAELSGEFASPDDTAQDIDSAQAHVAAECDESIVGYYRQMCRNPDELLQCTVDAPELDSAMDCWSLCDPTEVMLLTMFDTFGGSGVLEYAAMQLLAIAEPRESCMEDVPGVQFGAVAYVDEDPVMLAYNAGQLTVITGPQGCHDTAIVPAYGSGTAEHAFDFEPGQLGVMPSTDRCGEVDLSAMVPAGGAGVVYEDDDRCEVVVEHVEWHTSDDSASSLRAYGLTIISRADAPPRIVQEVRFELVGPTGGDPTEAVISTVASWPIGGGRIELVANVTHSLGHLRRMPWGIQLTPSATPRGGSSVRRIGARSSHTPSRYPGSSAYPQSSISTGPRLS